MNLKRGCDKTRLVFGIAVILALLLPSFYSYSQLPDSVLRQNCIKQYILEEDTISQDWLLHVRYANEQKELFEPLHLKDLDSTEIKFEPFSYVFKSVNELFNGFFERYRIYVVDFLGSYQASDCRGDFAKIYLVDAYSGKIKHFNNIKSFNSFLRSAQKPVNVIDKAYLYRYFAMRINDTLQEDRNRFHDYPKNLQEGCVFSCKIAEPLFAPHYASCRSINSVDHSERFEQAMQQTTALSLSLFTFQTINKFTDSVREIAYQYKFSYSKAGDLKRVVVGTLK